LLAGGLPFSIVACLWLALRGIGSGYLFLWLGAGQVAGLALSLWRPNLWRLGLLIAQVPAAIAWVPLTLRLVGLAAPMVGRLPTRFPMDPMLAALVAFPVAVLCITSAASTQAIRGLRRTTAIFGIAAIFLLVAVAAVFPYTQARPKRHFLGQIECPGESKLVLRDFDALPVSTALADAKGWTRIQSVCGLYQGDDLLAKTAAALALTQSSIEILAHENNPDTERLSLLIRSPPGTQLDLAFPAEELVRWSLPVDKDRVPTDQGFVVARFFGLPPEGRVFDLWLKPGTTSGEVREWIPTATKETSEAAALLPPWATVFTYAYRVTPLIAGSEPVRPRAAGSSRVEVRR
jgi:hypothetical protein